MDIPPTYSVARALRTCTTNDVCTDAISRRLGALTYRAKNLYICIPICIKIILLKLLTFHAFPKNEIYVVAIRQLLRKLDLENEVILRQYIPCLKPSNTRWSVMYMVSLTDGIAKCMLLHNWARRISLPTDEHVACCVEVLRCFQTWSF
jgi:hypothetical protein